MKKEVFYRYLGTNGIIDSPIHLEDIYYIRQYQLSADEGKILKNGDILKMAVLIPENEVDSWVEIDN